MMVATSSATTIALAAIQTAQVVLLAYVAMIAARYASKMSADSQTELLEREGVPPVEAGSDQSQGADVVIRHELFSEKPDSSDAAKNKRSSHP